MAMAGVTAEAACNYGSLELESALHDIARTRIQTRRDLHPLTIAAPKLNGGHAEGIPLLNENHILTCTTCIRTDALLETIELERYAAAGYKTADYPLFLDLAKRYDIAYIDEPLACYRVVGESISHPTELNRQLEWKLAYYRVKMDQIDAVEVSEEVAARARGQYHRLRFQLGWLRGDAVEVESAAKELERLDSTTEIHWVGNRARRHLVRSRLTWRVGRLLERGLLASRQSGN